MTAKKPEKKNPVGKPPGTRQKNDLYTRILHMLKQDRDQKGQGYTAFALSKYIGEPYPTVQQYLGDLHGQKMVKSHKIVNMTLFSITNKGIASLSKTISKD